MLNLASIIFISPGINITYDKIEIKFSNKFISDLDVFYEYTKYDLSNLIGITGSNGKSSFLKLTHDIIKKKTKESFEKIKQSNGKDKDISLPELNFDTIN